jgi:hypothetical protein
MRHNRHNRQSKHGVKLAKPNTTHQPAGKSLDVASVQKDVAIRKPNPTHQPGRKPSKTSGGRFRLPRWAILALCVVLAFGGSWAVFEGTWAVLEFFVWAKLPPELVGKWVVEGGEQDGATFDFSRNGTLEAHLNNRGQEHILKAKVAVEDKKLLITTQNPHTKLDETRACIMRELTQNRLVVEFEKGEVFKMARAN